MPPLPGKHDSMLQEEIPESSAKKVSFPQWERRPSAQLVTSSTSPGLA